ncbi:GntR family transcriptional regulator [Fodinicurvata halophila]|uniref:GntR family transcriptional regulator n=1 Tax=Fodinicurvata halophila TaxID=1419723 RepID=A0ABV8UFB4_9PROT
MKEAEQQLAQHSGEDEGAPSARNLGRLAHSRIRADILSLGLAPGEVVSERGLQGVYGISRTPIREALAALIREGLVVRTARGYAVAPFDLRELREIFDYREIVEDAAVRLACRNATPQELDDLQKTVDRGLAAFTPDDWFEAGLDVHVRIAALSCNRFLCEAVRDTVNRTLRPRWLLASSEEAREAAHREHSEIVDLIRRQEEEPAARAIRLHGRDVRDRILSAISDSRRIFGARAFAEPGRQGD